MFVLLEKTEEGMMSALLTSVTPVMGPAYDPERPETKQAWLEFRRNGITATEIRDWDDPAKRRRIITGKVTGESDEPSGFAGRMMRHGHLREPEIAAWVEGKFGIEPCSNVYAHGENPRHLASPDGVSRVPFSTELAVGSDDAVLLEVKTSGADLTPGELDGDRVLVNVKHGSRFDKAGYYTQMQWQMYVMNATRTLFVWEIRSTRWDEETGTFEPDGAPQWCWIRRDQEHIDYLVDEVAPAALAEIDSARASFTGLPPASSFDPDVAMLVSDLLDARDAEAVAVAAKNKAWDALKERFLGGPDVQLDGGFAQITVNSKRNSRRVFDRDSAVAEAPDVVSAYEALVERFTSDVVSVSQSLTVTRKKQ